MNLLVTLNAGYLRQLTVMLTSILACHPERCTVYVLHTSLSPRHIEMLSAISPLRCKIISIPMPHDFFSMAPTSKRYPAEMYFRIFAAGLLPENLERVLYLDPDLVVINRLDELYNIDFQGMLWAAASHVLSPQLNRINELRLSMPENRPYVNSGVMMMNLALLREQQDQEEVLEYIQSHKTRLMFPDQDVVNAVYGERILPIDPLRYNLSERYFGLYNLYNEHHTKTLDLEWVERNTCIIHYCGKNKPWKKGYIGQFDRFYRRYEDLAKEAGLV